MKRLFGLTQRVRDLPLFWKMLVPLLIAILLIGTVGTFALVRNLTDRARAELDADLTQRSLAARSIVHDRELSLLESANLAANVEGMSSAVEQRREAAVLALLQSVLALKSDVTLVAAVDRSGRAVGELFRSAPGRTPVSVPEADWLRVPFVTQALKDRGGSAAGFLELNSRSLIGLATSICSQPTSCRPVGAAIVALDANNLVTDARDRTGAAKSAIAGVALFSEGGRLVAATQDLTVRSLPPQNGDDFVRRSDTIDGRAVETLYAPLTLQGRKTSTLAVTIPRPPRFGAVRSAAVRIAFLILAVMAGIVAVGAGVSRFVLAQVRPILATNRKLAEGDLSARAPVLGSDEHGELARGLNQMADALQESHQTLEAKVEQRTAELERLLQERTDFFAAVSHEFRTPLAVILGQAEMLSNPNFPKKAAWHAQAGGVLADAANQLLTFVNDILEIAKAESGRIEIHLKDVRLAAVMDALRPSIEALTRHNGLTASVRMPQRVPVVRADETRVREVILNLVDNAVKYTPSGGRVDIVLRSADGGVALSVGDTGIGIPADAVDRIFEPFYRVKDAETHGGQPSSGLGLALVKRLVEAQGGTVSVQSEPGEGSEFTVWFPAARAARRHAPTRVVSPKEGTAVDRRARAGMRDRL